MKKVLVIIFAITLATGAFAQDSTNATNNLTQNNTTQVHKMQNHDGVMMQNGKIIVMKNGQSSPLTQDLVLADGTTVMADGRVKMKDGTTSTLQDGDYIRMDGTRGSMKMMQNNMPKQMQTDSAK
jgi:hypothetical protein